MSDYPTKLDFCDGKYTVIYDFKTGQSECLRYGKPWRQLVGDKMVLAMFDRVVELQAENAALKAELAAARIAYARNGMTRSILERELPAEALCDGDRQIPLYLHPQPDQSAEAERLRERAKRIEEFWAAKCATIEAEVESLRLALETENGAATLYAKQVAHWIGKHDALLERIRKGGSEDDRN